MGEKREDLILVDKDLINKIHHVRGHNVILDHDLAELYDFFPIRLRQQVKRKINRFPETFMFQLTQDEAEIMISKNAIPSKQHMGGFLPYVFTEHGVLMLANVLRSEWAIEVSIRLLKFL